MLTRGAINKPLVVLLILAVVPIVGCSGGDLGPYRYRMTVEVKTPQGIRTGSSVIEVRSRATSRYSLKRGWTYHQVWGEAVTVDLPSGDTLYALLSRRPGGDVDSGAAVFAFIAIPPSKTPIEEKIPLFHAQGGAGVLPEEFYPVLVRFRDHLKPETAEQVDARAFAQSFGKGYKINRIVTEITQASVTNKLRIRLPWLDLSHKHEFTSFLDRGYRGGLVRDATFSQRLVDRDFIQRGLE